MDCGDGGTTREHTRRRNRPSCILSGRFLWYEWYLHKAVTYERIGSRDPHEAGPCAPQSPQSTLSSVGGDDGPRRPRRGVSETREKGHQLHTDTSQKLKRRDDFPLILWGQRHPHPETEDMTRKPEADVLMAKRCCMKETRPPKHAGCVVPFVQSFRKRDPRCGGGNPQWLRPGGRRGAGHACTRGLPAPQACPPPQLHARLPEWVCVLELIGLQALNVRISRTSVRLQQTC